MRTLPSPRPLTGLHHSAPRWRLQSLSLRQPLRRRRRHPHLANRPRRNSSSRDFQRTWTTIQITGVVSQQCILASSLFSASWRDPGWSTGICNKDAQWKCAGCDEDLYCTLASSRLASARISSDRRSRNRRRVLQAGPRRRKSGGDEAPPASAMDKQVEGLRSDQLPWEPRRELS